MSKLTQNAYGKSDVRLTKVTRRPDGRHDLKEMSVNIQLQGAFERCYTHGDNSMIVPTDTMKNTVYAIAKNHPIDAIEDYATTLGRHFVDNFPQISSATVEISQVPWTRIAVNGQPHAFSFAGGSSERRTCVATARRDSVSVESGIDGLLVLKTTQSGFIGYIKDELTTLKETIERIFATSVSAIWTYRHAQSRDWNRCHELIRQALLEVFATHDSLAVQQTLYAMGDAALAKCDEVQQISLTMPNQHRLLVNLEPFGMENRNEIFVPTEEPFGLISGTIMRE